MEKHIKTEEELFPAEIKALLIVECFVNSVQDMHSLMCANKSFYDAKKMIVWKEAYYKLYAASDELNVDQPSHEIKLFLRYFLPEDPNAGNDEWYKATLRRTKYDNAILRINTNKTAKDRTGWRTVLKDEDHPREQLKYKQNVNLNTTYTYGFVYNYVKVSPQKADIQVKFHLCFLELTVERFLADPTAYPITAIDIYHFTKRVNMHLVYSNMLCSRPIPPALPEAIITEQKHKYNNFNGSEPIFLNGDNVEYTIQPGREWGVYTNFACEGLFWGKELDELMKNKYKVDISLYDPTLFEPRPNFRNFSDLRQ